VSSVPFATSFLTNYRSLSKSCQHRGCIRRRKPAIYVYIVKLDVGGNPYEMFFMLQWAAAQDASDLRLTVESAYCADGPVTLRKRPNSIRFAVLAHKVLTKQPVRFGMR